MDFDLTSLFGGPMGTSLFGGPGGPLFGGKPSGAGPLFGDMAVPGMPKTGGMLRAGDDDMKPPGLPSPGAGLLKAGMEGPQGQPRSLIADNPADTPAVGSQVAAGGPPTAGAFVIPGTGQTVPTGSPGATTPMPAAPAPALASPAGAGRMPDPDRFVPNAPPRIPNAGGGPDERVAAPAPIVPPKIDVSKPTAGGGTVGGQAAPPAAGAAPAADPATTGTPGAAAPAAGTGMDKFREWLSKTGSISGKQQPPPAGRSPGAVGAPHIPQGGAQLLQSILDAHAKSMPHAGPISPLPQGLLRRFQGA